jgi:hypothetical protein
VDALALRADEGRGRAAKSVGEPRAGIDPTISEWGNPPPLGGTAALAAGGTGGTETSHVPRGTDSIPVVVASEPGNAQTVVVFKPAGVAATGLEDRSGRAAVRQVRHKRNRRRLESVATDRDSRVGGSRMSARLALE